VTILGMVIEPLFEADFVRCSFGFRREKTPRMALSVIAEKKPRPATFTCVDVDLKSLVGFERWRENPQLG
jgi:hypothetical protein